VTDRPTDGLPEVVSRHGLDGQKAEQDFHAGTGTFRHMPNSNTSNR